MTLVHNLVMAQIASLWTWSVFWGPGVSQLAHLGKWHVSPRLPSPLPGPCPHLSILQVPRTPMCHIPLISLHMRNLSVSGGWDLIFSPSPEDLDWDCLAEGPSGLLPNQNRCAFWSGTESICWKPLRILNPPKEFSRVGNVHFKQGKWNAWPP